MIIKFIQSPACPTTNLQCAFLNKAFHFVRCSAAQAPIQRYLRGVLETIELLYTLKGLGSKSPEVHHMHLLQLHDANLGFSVSIPWHGSVSLDPLLKKKILAVHISRD